jgi:hypothetical protein
VRDPQRIDRILEKVRILWYTYPDQRLGQLLANYGFGHHTDPFHVEDDGLEAELDKMLDAQLDKRLDERQTSGTEAS